MKNTIYTTGVLSAIALLLLTFEEIKPEKQLAYTTVTCASVVPEVPEDRYKTDNAAPLFDGLGNHEFPISTQNELVQKYFNQGLVLAYGFNHAEAARSFYYASKLDSNCAMAFWGYAYVLGPNYNVQMNDDDYLKAHNAIQKAVELKENCTPKEMALIVAMQKRYEKESPEDRSSMDKAYAGALKKAVKIEDSLNYNEPPDWFFSVRHNLGAVQIEAKKYRDAVQTFHEDLEEYPKNG